MTRGAAQFCMRRIKLKARGAMVECRQFPRIRCFRVAAQAIRLALLRELSNMRVNMAINAVAPSRTFIATPVRGGQLALGMTRIALRPCMRTLQSKLSPIAMVEGAQGRSLKTARFMTARTITSPLDMSGQPFAIKDAIVRTRMTTDASAGVARIVIRNESKAARVDAFPVTARTRSLLMRSIEREARPGRVVKSLMQLLETCNRMTSVAADAP